jgi:4'-phosphopantetheinyl transferase
MITWCVAPADPHGRAADRAAALLSRAELQELVRLRLAKRRREWLLGRAAVKQLACAHLRRAGRRVAPHELSVLADPDGAPQVRWDDGEPVPVTVSVSHRAGMVVAALCDTPRAPLGIDVELCEPRPPTFASDYFTHAEVACVERAPSDDRPRLETEVWSLKEAALKALRVGLSVDTRSIEVRPRAAASPGWGRAGVLRPHGPAGAFVRDHGDYVVSVVLLEAGATATPVEEPGPALGA